MEFLWFCLICLALVVVGQHFVIMAMKKWMHEANAMLLEHHALLLPNERPRNLKPPTPPHPGATP